MDRLTWTDLDVKAARREWAVAMFNLADPVPLPAHLRDASRDHWKPGPSGLARARGKHRVPASDEEGSPVLLDITIPVHVIQVAAVVVLVAVGVRVVRSLFG